MVTSILIRKILNYWCKILCYGIRRVINMSKELTAVVLGTNTVCAALAKYIKKNNSINKLRILGFGYQATRGLEYGRVHNLKNVEDSVIGAISTASNLAQKRVRSVIVALPPWAINSQLFETSQELNQTAVDMSVIKTMMNSCVQEGEEVLHIIPIDYSLDGASNIKDPIGMTGKKISAIFHILSAKQNLLNNLRGCFNRNNIEVSAFVASPLMSALSLIDTNKQNILVIDIGGTCTSVSCVSGDTFLYSNNVPIGSDSITHDIVTVLKTDVNNAERLKILYGVTGIPETENQENIVVPIIDEMGEQTIQYVPYSLLNMVISSRLDEILETVKQHILDNNIDEEYFQNVLITGGGSRLMGLGEYIGTKNFLIGSSISIACPTGTIGGDDYVRSASFTTAMGTLLYGFEKMERSAVRKKSLLEKIKTWFKDGM